MTVQELINLLSHFDSDAAVITGDSEWGWDTISRVEEASPSTAEHYNNMFGADKAVIIIR
jgi:predicted phosphohydrolase